MGKEADQIIDLYRRHAQTWAERRRKDLIEKPWLDRFLAPQPNCPNILDLGCGSGQPIGTYLSDKKSTITGVDSSPEMIEIAQNALPKARWLVADIRDLDLGQAFDGILAWNSSFHLTPDQQRHLFGVFARHARHGTMLMFTSGPNQGEKIGRFANEPLYHASLDPEEYRQLLKSHGFDYVSHAIEDPDCAGHSVWLARFADYT